MGAGTRAATDVTRYALDEAAATRRARWAALVSIATPLGPVVLGVVLLRRLAWGPSPLVSAVVAALLALIVVRGCVRYAAVKRRVGMLVVTLEDDEIRVETTRDGVAIARADVTRIVEIDGSLGGLVVESRRAAGESVEAHIPQGGHGYAELCAKLERWRPVERRPRGRPSTRLMFGAVIVAAFFFVPFFLDDVVAHSKFFAAGMVAASWLALRMVLRGR